jgi:membrane fusion protein, multidrug efflux system
MSQVANIQPSQLAKTQPAYRPRNHRLRWGLAFLALIVIALVVRNLFFTETRHAKGTAAQVVEVAQARLGQMPVILNELGTVTPTATVTVLPNQAVSGYLTEIPFREGQDVEKGQLLAQIDPRPYEVLEQQEQAQLAKDKAALAQARSDLARYKRLAEQKSIAEQTYVDQKFLVQQDAAAVMIDQANIAQYALDITYCHITAPVAGRVGLRLVDPGNYITGTSSTGLAVITTMKPTTVEFTVAQNDLDNVVERFNDPGAPLSVTVFTSDNSKKLATGTLYAINNQMTTSTGTVTLRATFPNQDEALFPTEFVNVQLLVETLTDVVLVPTPAVLTGAPGNYVFLVNKNDTVSVRTVTVGPSDGTNTVISNGLTTGDLVVTDGTDRLSDGASIKIANAAQLGRPDTRASQHLHSRGQGGRRHRHVHSPDQ